MFIYNMNNIGFSMSYMTSTACYIMSSMTVASSHIFLYKKEKDKKNVNINFHLYQK